MDEIVPIYLRCFVEKVEALIANKELRTQMGVNARQFIIKEYSEKSVLNKWMNLYE